MNNFWKDKRTILFKEYHVVYNGKTKYPSQASTLSNRIQSGCPENVSHNVEFVLVSSLNSNTA